MAILSTILGGILSAVGDAVKNTTSSSSSVGTRSTTVSPTITMPKQTARQRMLAQEEDEDEDRWYKGDTPTSSEIAARIYTIGKNDPEQGEALWNAFSGFTSDPSNPLYNPYTKATNNAVGEMEKLGFDMSRGVSEEWIRDNSGLMNHYRTGTSGTPLSPASKSTKEQDAAYWYYQILQDEERTQKAENEWAALQEEITYWTRRTDRNYSDQEILDRIDWSDYATLTSMDEAKGKGVPLSLNRAVGYSQDALAGVIWAARNNGGTGNAMADSVKAALGDGNVWKENADIAARLDPMNDRYNPYAVGATLDDAALYFGANDFSGDWLEANRGYLASRDATAKKYYGKVYDAEQNTLKAEAEVEELWRRIEYELENTPEPNADYILDGILDGYYDGEKPLSTLMKMDESLKSGDLMATTRAIDYSWAEVEAEVRRRCEQKNKATKSGAYVQSVGNTLGHAVPSVDSNGAINTSKDASISAASGSIASVGTPEEKIVWSKAYSSDHDTYIAQIQESIANGVTDPQGGYDYTLGRADSYAAENYMEVLEAIVPYQQAEAELAAAKAQKEKLLADPQTSEEALAAVDTEINKQNRILETYGPKQQAAQEKKNSVAAGYNVAARLAKLSGVSEADALSTMRTLEHAYQFAESYTPDWNAYSLFDMAIADGYSYEQVASAAKRGKIANKEQINRILYTLDQIEQRGMKLDEKYIRNMEREIARLERENLDADYFMLREKEDFAEVVEATRSKVTDAWDNWYDIRPTFMDRNGYSELDASMVGNAAWSMRADNMAKWMTSEEQDAYLYILGTQGREAAEAYYAHMADETYGALPVRMHQGGTKFWKDFANEHGVAGTALSVIASPLQLAGTIYGIKQSVAGGEINPYAGAFSATSMIGTTRGAVKENITKHYGENTLASTVANIAYDALTSTADNAMNAASLGGFLGKYSMGATFASGSFQDAGARGVEGKDALLYAGVNFIIESVTESHQFEAFNGRFIGKATDKVKSSLIKKIVTDAGIEFFGEGASELGTQISDKLIMGELSNWDTLVNGYRDSGMEEKDAIIQAAKDCAGNVLYAAVVGGVSGAMSGSTRKNPQTPNSPQSQQPNAPRQDNQEEDVQEAPEAAQDDAQQPTEEMDEETDILDEEAPTGEIMPEEEQVEEEPFEEAAAPEETAKTARRITALTQALETSDEASQTATIAAVMMPEGADTNTQAAVSAAAQHLASRFGGSKAADVVRETVLIAAESGLPQDMVSDALSVAAIGNGEASEALDTLAEFPTAENLEALLVAANNDRQNPAVAQNVQKTTVENMIAQREKQLIGDGAASGVASYETAVGQARANVRAAKHRLKTAQREQAVAGQNLQAVNAEFAADPKNEMLRGATQQAIKDVEGKALMTAQAQQGLETAESQLAESEKTLDAMRQSTMKQVREQAQQDVVAQQEEEAQAQAMAQEAHAQMQYQFALEKLTPTKQLGELMTVKLTGSEDTVQITGPMYADDDGLWYWATSTGEIMREDSLDAKDMLFVLGGFDTNGWAEELKNVTKPAILLKKSVKVMDDASGEVYDIIGINPIPFNTPGSKDYHFFTSELVKSDMSTIKALESTPMSGEAVDTLYNTFMEEYYNPMTAQNEDVVIDEPVDQAQVAPQQEGPQLESWQDPQYHGKVKKAKKLRTDTKNFKKWFNDPSGDLTNADGTPKVIYRGTTSTVYMEHKAQSGGAVMNFYSPDLSIVRTYANNKTGKIMSYDIVNWETAEAAMKAEGYELRKEQHNGEWGYRPVKEKNGSIVSLGEFYRENELARFNKEYGKIRRSGLYAGYMSLDNPLVIDAHGSTYTHVTATVKDEHGNDYSATKTNREWGKWARAHGYDACIVRNVKDNFTNNSSSTIPGTVIMAFKPSSFKSMWNTGKLGKNTADIRYNKAGTFALTGKPVSSEMKAVQNKLAIGHEVPIEDIMDTPEVKWAESRMKKGDTIPYRSKPYTEDEMAEMVSPERFSLQEDIRDEINDLGSAVIDKDGKAHYTGRVRQEKRLDVVIGPPAAGKSSALADWLSQRFGSRVLDSDMVKERLPEYENGLNSGYLHNESRYIWNLTMIDAAERNENVVLPVVGGSLSSVQRNIALFEDAGYSVNVHYVTLERGKTLSRALGRFVSDGRYIDPSYLYSVTNGNIDKTYEALKTGGELYGYSKWNNDVARGQHPILLESKGIGTEVFDDPRGKTDGRISVHDGRDGGSLGGSGSKAQGGKSSEGKGVSYYKGSTQQQKQGASSVDGTPKRSPHQIARDLSKKLGIGHSIGTKKMNNLPREVLGYYEERAKYIAVRSTEAGNYITTMHELGHAISDKTGMTGTKRMIDALDPRFAANYSDAELPGEAFAEFMWHYMADDASARTLAGDAYVDAFEDALRRSGIYSDVRKSATDLRAWMNADVNNQIGATIHRKSEKQKKGFVQSVREFFSQMVDNTSAAEAVMHEIREQMGDDVPFDMNVRGAALMKNTAARRAFSILTNKLTNSRWQVIGESLAERFERVGLTAKDMDLYERYCLALHSLDRDKHGKPVFDDFISKSAREQFIKDVQQNHPEVAAAEQEFQAFRTEFMQAFMVNTGYLSQEAFDKMNRMYPHYVPTMRVKDGTPTGGNKSSSKTYTIRGAKGSTEDIWSPLDTFVGMVDSIVGMVSANNAALAWDNAYMRNEGLGVFGRKITPDSEKVSVDVSELQQQIADLLTGNTDDDIFRKVVNLIGTTQSQYKSTGGSDQPNVLTVQHADGSKAYYQMYDEELYKLLASLDEKDQGHLFRAIGTVTRGMTALTTGSNPVFAVRNFMRDFQNSVNYGSWAYTYADGLVKWLASAYEVFTKSGQYKDYVALGGGGWTRIDAMTEKGADDYRGALFKGYNTRNAGVTAKYAGKKIWALATLDRLNEVVEQASRYAEYRYGNHDTTTVSGRQEAFLAAQDVSVDFTRHGNAVMANQLKQLIPFFNASMQGVYRTGRMFTEAERGRLPQRFTKTIVNNAMMSALAAGILLKYLGEEEKEEFEMMSDDLKAQHLYLPNCAPEVFGEAPLIRIPLAQDPLSYAIHGLVTNAIWNGEADGLAIDFAGTANAILDNLNPLGSGTVFQPFIGVATNKNWYGSEIVSSYMSDWHASTQYDEETPEVFRWAGRMLNNQYINTGLSPLALQYLAEQYTGFIGQMLIPSMQLDEEGKSVGFGATIASVRKRFTSDPLVSNDVISSFYDGYDALGQVTSAVKNDKPLNMLRAGLSYEQAQNAYEEAKELTSSKGILGAARTFISDGYKEIEAINANDTLTDEQKYVQTSAIRREMIATAMTAQEAYGEFKEKYMTGDNLLRIATQGGTMTDAKTAYQKLPQAFLADENESYMQQAKAVWEATGKDSAIPHPNEKFTLDGVEYVIGDEDWDGWTQAYKKSYKAYVDANSRNFSARDEAEQLKVMTKAHERAHEDAKKWYMTQHGIRAKKK